MTVFRNAAFAAIAFACLSSAASAETSSPAQARIVYADLDLATKAGRATLDRRLAAAVRTVCATGTNDLESARDASRCRVEIVRTARAQVAALVGQRATQVAAR